MRKDSSRRVVSLHLPYWPGDRLRRKSGAAIFPLEKPLVTAKTERGKRVVEAADAIAQAQGLHAGMTIAQARALVPGLSVAGADHKKDMSALRQLGEWALARYSPIVALDPPDGLLIDATGCTHLYRRSAGADGPALGSHGLSSDLQERNPQFLRSAGIYDGEAALLEDLTARLSKAKISARAAMACTTGAAHALARFAPRDFVPILQQGEEKAALGPLPLAALRLDIQTTDALNRLGFVWIGQLINLPRAPLVRRFGAKLVLRLDQALGLADEPLDPIELPLKPSESLSFIEPIGTAGQLALVIKDLTEALCLQLTREGLGARRLDLTFTQIDGNSQAIRAGTSAPLRDPKYIARLLTDQIETIDPGLGIERMTLKAPLVEPLGAHQLTSLPGEEILPFGLMNLADRLSNRFGKQNLYRLAPRESEVPERSVHKISPIAPPRGTSWPLAWPRPARLLDPPEEVKTLALLPDHPPAQFIWRRQFHRILRADGPERIYGEWWQSEDETEALRDYFHVEDESGAQFWLYRAGDGLDPATGSQRWFIHGLFG